MSPNQDCRLYLHQSHQPQEVCNFIFLGIITGFIVFLKDMTEHFIFDFVSLLYEG